ncbi:hypothetical protein MRB53_033593 [Persea americana]|uniref:Uncharacterized protein n=1 Tax=Persea americana TaxID=3435 RepID=A0ACC2KVN6_PERAE|nr:hypothetical protein MRB53_033593 [Persea americana]
MSFPLLSQPGLVALIPPLPTKATPPLPSSPFFSPTNFDYDCEGSSLFCSEDNNSIMGFDDNHHETDVVDGETKYQHGHNQRQSLLVDFLVDFPIQTDECLGLMIENESQHMPRDDYMMKLQSGVLDSSLRRAAIDWIWKVHAYYRFGPLSVYLSVNYLDRFLSACELSQGKPWMMQLLSVACLSLAAKMEETQVPLSLDLQKINDDKPPPKSSLLRSVELVLGTIRGVDFLEFRPSEVAAAVAISVSVEAQTVDFNKALSSCIHVEKVKKWGRT